MTKVYIDVNVLLDFLLFREDHFDEASQIMGLAQWKMIEAFVVPNTFVFAYFKLNKHLKDPLETKHRLALLRKVIRCVTVDEKLLDGAIRNETPADLEDSIQLEAALKARAKYLITRDKGFPKNKRIQVVTPTQFLSYFEHT